jgi:hypothetical protein
MELIIHSSHYLGHCCRNPDKPWNWAWLSNNPNITWDIVEANPDKPWNWAWLSNNPNITWDVVAANPNKPWGWYWLSRNLNITRENIETNPMVSWDWCGLSRNIFTKEKEIFELRVRYQRFVQENLFEEFVKAYNMHPNRIIKLLSMGYSVDDLDELL